MDVEKLWNLTKEDSISQTINFSSSFSRNVFARSFSTKSSSSLKSHFTRSFSTKSSSSPSSKSHFTRSFSTTTSSSPSSKSHFMRSVSTKPSSSSCPWELIFRRIVSAKPKSSKSLSDLSRSSSMKCSADFSSKFSLSRSLSQKGASVSRKWCRVAKEHKSRFYIIKRCVLMLVCWHKHS